MHVLGVRTARAALCFLGATSDKVPKAPETLRPHLEDGDTNVRVSEPWRVKRECLRGGWRIAELRQELVCLTCLWDPGRLELINPRRAKPPSGALLPWLVGTLKDNRTTDNVAGASENVPQGGTSFTALAQASDSWRGLVALISSPPHCLYLEFYQHTGGPASSFSRSPSTKRKWLLESFTDHR